MILTDNIEVHCSLGRPETVRCLATVDAGIVWTHVSYLEYPTVCMRSMPRPPSMYLVSIFGPSVERWWSEVTTDHWTQQSDGVADRRHVTALIAVGSLRRTLYNNDD